MTKILVALYEQKEEAQQAAQQLSTLGIPQNEISALPGQGGSSPAGLLGDARSGAPLVRKLTEFGVPQDQAELYAQGLEHGLNFVLARVENDRAEEASQVMEGQSIVDIEASVERWASPGEEEQTVQAIEEELHVGKRQTSGGRVRLHTIVEERPVEERIRLHEEEVHVERRKVGRPVSPEDAKKGFEERTVEVSATIERPVVSKEARVVEEVAVGKTSREREEVVRDTVRRSKIEIEDETRAGEKVDG
ncbi:MAG: YsnF/AvaK domain-containing protein [Rhodoplanes sp.]